MEDYKKCVAFLLNMLTAKGGLEITLDEDGHLTIRDKAEMFSAFFPSVFNTDEEPWDP